MYKKSSKGWLKHLDFIIIDAVCLQVAFILAYMLRQRELWPYNNPLYENMALLLMMIQLTVTFLFDSFKNVLKKGYYKELLSTLKQTCMVILITICYFFITQTGQQYSRMILALTWLLYFTSAYITRIIWKKILKTSKKSEKDKRSLLIITRKNMVYSVLYNIHNHNYEGFQVTGIVITDLDMTGQELEGIPVVANEQTAVDYVCQRWVDEILINLPKNQYLSENTMNSFMEMGITIHQKIADFNVKKAEKQSVEKIGGYTVLTSSINMASSRELFFKRSMDIVGGMVGCMIAGILYVILAPFIYLKSPGPILFSQERIGKNGRTFKIYKFRSMYIDAEERKKELLKQNQVTDGMMFKLANDPRIIGGEHGIGAFIRKYSLDEWPQMWNVLKGDMSLVGTRPPTVDEWKKYQYHHRARLSIKPGLTGMWQISGRSNITDFEEVVKLDKSYITQWSFKLDIKILFKTIQVVFYNKGAY